uniref:Uncharacterized protein n=1 Tax=Rhizophora mucronata TaxID=61149 RepID=A0A2P2Q978_RHIMU
MLSAADKTSGHSMCILMYHQFQEISVGMLTLELSFLNRWI